MSPDTLLSLNLPRELIVIIIAMLPIFELRGAIPVAINIFGMPWYYALLLALVGNLLPVPLILLFLEAISKWLSRVPVLSRGLTWLFERTRRRSGIIEKYKRIGLMLFVAVPLPATGAWTGSLAAVLLGLGFWPAFLAIVAGVLIAGAIVTCLSLLGWIGAVVAGVVLVGVAVSWLWRTVEKSNS